MRSRKSPTSVAAEETIGRTQDTIGIAVQRALLLTGVEVRRLVGGALSGRRSSCGTSPLLASARREAALGPLVGCFAFLSIQMRAPLTQHDKAFYCIHYESHLVPSDTKAFLPAEPKFVGSGHMASLGQKKTYPAFHSRGCPLIRD